MNNKRAMEVYAETKDVLDESTTEERRRIVARVTHRLLLGGDGEAVALLDWLHWHALALGANLEEFRKALKTEREG